MVELKPAEYELVAAAVGTVTLDDIAAECESTPGFWQRLTEYLGERGVREIHDAAAARLVRTF